MAHFSCETSYGINPDSRSTVTDVFFFATWQGNFQLHVKAFALDLKKIRERIQLKISYSCLPLPLALCSGNFRQKGSVHLGWSRVQRCQKFLFPGAFEANLALSSSGVRRPALMDPWLIHDRPLNIMNHPIKLHNEWQQVGET